MPSSQRKSKSEFIIFSLTLSNAQERDFLICKLNTSPECRTPSPFMGGHLNSHFKMVCLNNVRIRAQMSAFNAEKLLGKCGWRDLLESQLSENCVLLMTLLPQAPSYPSYEMEMGLNFLDIGHYPSYTTLDSCTYDNP